MHGARGAEPHHDKVSTNDYDEAALKAVIGWQG